MSSPHLRIVESFPEPEFTALRSVAFADFGERSTLLADVLIEEANRRSEASRSAEQTSQQLRIGAFIDDRLIAWSYSRGEGNQLHMVNSGVIPDLRRRGIYSRFVKKTIAYADSHGFAKIFSRHVPSNSAVIISKLRLGFMVLDSSIPKFMALLFISPT